MNGRELSSISNDSFNLERMVYDFNNYISPIERTPLKIACTRIYLEENRIYFQLTHKGIWKNTNQIKEMEISVYDEDL